ncbi:hypothetical protein ACWDRR_00810 [Kitasatospora sp. NPDC003701]
MSERMYWIPGGRKALLFRVVMRHKASGRLLALMARQWDPLNRRYFVVGEDYVEPPPDGQP